MHMVVNRRLSQMRARKLERNSPERKIHVFKATEWISWLDRAQYTQWNRGTTPSGGFESDSRRPYFY